MRRSIDWLWPPSGPVDQVQQRAQLLAGEVTDLAHLQGAEPHRPDADPGQAPDRVPDVLHRTAHDVVATLVQREPHQRLPTHRRDELDAARVHRPVVEDDAVLEPLERHGVDDALDLDEVGLVDLEARVRQLVAEVAVVGEDDQALGVGVEPADVEEPFLEQRLARPGLDDGVGERPPALGVGQGRDDAAGLVQHDVAVPPGRRDARAVDADDVVLGVDAAALLAHDVAVHLDPALVDHRLRRPARRQAGLGQDLLQPLPGGLLGVAGLAAGVRRTHALVSSSWGAGVATAPGSASGTSSATGAASAASSASSSSTSGRCGASGGRSSRLSSPIFSRNCPVVANTAAPVSGSWPASSTSPRASSVRMTPSTFTPRIAATRPRETGCWYAITARVSRAAWDSRPLCPATTYAAMTSACSTRVQ